PRGDRPQRRQRDPLPPVRPAARPPAADGGGRHALPPGPHRQDPRRARGDPPGPALGRRGGRRGRRPPARRLVLAPGPGRGAMSGTDRAAAVRPADPPGGRRALAVWGIGVSVYFVAVIFRTSLGVAGLDAAGRLCGKGSALSPSYI